jgi:hypothetical protein
MPGQWDEIVPVTRRQLHAHGLKYCNDCSEVKTLAEFSTYRDKLFGGQRYRPCCKVCANLRSIAYHRRRGRWH